MLIHNLSFILHATFITCYAQCPNQIQVLDDCTCVGYVAEFECAHSVQNRGSTIWYFDDSSMCRIILLHSEFPDTGETSCSTRNVFAYSTSNEDNCFTSRLKVNVTASDNNKAVVCLYNNGSIESIVDNQMLTITDTVNASYNVRLESVDFDHSICTFAWDHSDNCPDSYYLVNATSCDCPNKTTEGTVTCSNVQTECTVSVRRIVCGGDVSGEFSEPATCEMNPHKKNTFDLKYLILIILVPGIIMLACIFICVAVKCCPKRHKLDTRIKLKPSKNSQSKILVKTPTEEEGLPGQATVDAPHDGTRSGENITSLVHPVVPFSGQAESLPTTWPRKSRPISENSATPEFSENLMTEILKQIKSFKSEVKEDQQRTEAELQSTKEGLKQLKDKVDSQDKAIQKKDDEICEIKRELETTKGRLSELERENTLLKQNIEHERKKYKRKVEDLQKKIEDLEIQKKQLEREKEETIVSKLNKNHQMLTALLTTQQLQQAYKENVAVGDETK